MTVTRLMKLGFFILLLLAWCFTGPLVLYKVHVSQASLMIKIIFEILWLPLFVVTFLGAKSAIIQSVRRDK